MVERSVCLTELTCLVGSTCSITPCLGTSQTLQTQTIDTGFQALDGLEGLKPLHVPVFCYAVIDGQTAAVTRIAGSIAFGCIVVSIGKHLKEGEVGILLMADCTETFGKLMVGLTLTRSIGVCCIEGIEPTVATHIYNSINLLVTRHEGGELILTNRLIPYNLFLIAIKFVAECTALQVLIVDNGSLQRCTIDTITVVEGRIVEAGQVLFVVLDTTYGST